MHAPTLQQRSSFMTLFPLLLVILLDIVGVILVIPVLTPLILQPDSGIVPLGTSSFVRDALFGISLALYPLAMFFSTPILGDLSDKFGRKKILMICLAFSSASYLVAIVGINLLNLWILLLSRLLAGFAAGTQSIATAAIIDASSSKSKSRNLSWVVFVNSIGLILGPVVGGLTADNRIVSWFNYTTPFYLAFIVVLLNLVYIYFALDHHPTNEKKQAIQLTKGFKLFIAAFLEKKFRLLSILFSCYTLAWSIYFLAINLYLTEKFHYSSTQLGLFVGFIGVLFAFSSSIISKWVLAFFSRDTTSFLVCITTMGLACFGTAMCSSESSPWLWAILLATSEVICFTVSLSLFSSLAGEESQGWIMGVNSALGAIIWGLGAVIAGPIGYLGLSLPFWVAGFLCLTSGGLMMLYKKSHD